MDLPNQIYHFYVLQKTSEIVSQLSPWRNQSASKDSGLEDGVEKWRAKSTAHYPATQRQRDVKTSAEVTVLSQAQCGVSEELFVLLDWTMDQHDVFCKSVSFMCDHKFKLQGLYKQI